MKLFAVNGIVRSGDNRMTLTAHSGLYEALDDAHAIGLHTKWLQEEHPQAAIISIFANDISSSAIAYAAKHGR